MPTTRFTDDSLTLLPPQYQWNWPSQQFGGSFINNFTGGNASSAGNSSGSEHSASDNFHEGSNSPLRSPDTTTTEDVAGGGGPYLQIREQPCGKFRFRYPTEMQGTHGAIMGASTIKNGRKTVPSVKLFNYSPNNVNEKIIIRCTLYTADTYEESRIPHVHRLVGKKDGSEFNDPLDIVVRPPDFEAFFANMTILFTKKEELVKVLVEKKRRHIKKMYTNGLNQDLVQFDLEQLRAQAERDVSTLNGTRLNMACLKFEALRNDEVHGLYTPICPPVFSKPITNPKNAQFNELRICRVDKVVGSCRGGDEVFIFVEKVNKKDIKIKFFEVNDDEEPLEIWSADAKFGEDDVHYQYGIAFRTPPYRDLNITENAKVYFRLERPSNKAESEAREFEYTPDNAHIQALIRKRPRLDSHIPTVVNSFTKPPSPVNFLPEPSVPPFQFPDDNSILNVLQDLFPSFQDGSASQPMEQDEDDITSLNSIIRDELLSSFSSGESELLSQFIKTEGLEEWARVNGVQENTVQKLRTEYAVVSQEQLGINPCDDLVTDGAPNSAEFHSGALNKGLQSQLMMTNRNKHKLSPNKIVQQMETVVNGLLQLKKSGKLTPSQFKNYLLHTFSSCVGDRDDCVFHILAKNEEFPVQTMKFVNVLKASNILETIMNLKNNEGQTALHVAVQQGNLQTICLLLDSGADVNVQDSKSNTPIHLVVTRENNPMDALDPLLRKNPDLSTCNEDGLNALHLSVISRRSDIISSLLIKSENGNCPIDIINQGDRKQGNTALHMAVQKRFKEVVSLLLNFDDRILVDVKNFEKKTPLAYVYEETDADSRVIADLLLSNKADSSLVSTRKFKPKDEDGCDNYSDEEEIDHVDDTLSSYAREWNSEIQMKLLDVETVSKLCPILDEEGDWRELIPKLGISVDREVRFSKHWSPSLSLLSQAAEDHPGMTTENLRDILLTMHPRLRCAAQYIDDMLLQKLGLV